MEQNNQDQSLKKTIWVITAIDSGVVNGVYTNCTDLDIRAAVVDVDTDYEDYETSRLAQDRLDDMFKLGDMRDIYYSPYWALLELDYCLCTNRCPEGKYEFIQVCKLEDGGFGIALVDGDAICPENYSREERQAFVGKAGYEQNDDRLDEDLENVYAAACIFKARLQEFIVPDVRFDTFEAARRHLAVNCVDCFIGSDIDYRDDAQPACHGLPMCVDVGKVLDGFDKETLVRLILCFNTHIANLSVFDPISGPFRLEEYLAKTPISEVKALAGPRGEKTSELREALDRMNEKRLAFALEHYNYYLKGSFREFGNITGVQPFDKYLSRMNKWFAGRPFWTEQRGE